MTRGILARAALADMSAGHETLTRQSQRNLKPDASADLAIAITKELPAFSLRKNQKSQALKNPPFKGRVFLINLR